MKKAQEFIIRKITKIVVFWVICGLAITYLGYRARLQQFDVFPPIGDTHDEIKGAFNGISLIKEGVPKSWSWFDEYKNFTLEKINGFQYRIVTPWFDEPPLFSLMEGGFALHKGMSSIEQVKVGILRHAMVIVATVNILLLFIIIWLLRDPVEAALGALIFAVEPTIVMSSRLPISDNMLATWALISLFLLIIYLRTKNTFVLLTTTIISASSVLLKSSGIFIPVSLIILLISQKEIKPAITQLISLLTALGIWLLYGYHYDWQLFMKIFQISSGRELFNPGMITSLLTAFRIGEKPMDFDPQLIWAWISVVAFSLLNHDNLKNNLSKLALPVMIGSYLVFFSVMSGHIKGWYRFPFYPFLSWASAAFFLYILKNPRFLTSLFFISIPVSSAYILGKGGNRWTSPETKLYQIILPLIMGVPLIYELTHRPIVKTLAQLVLIIAFAVLIIYDLRTVFYFQDYFWYS